ncbi:MAG: hypothetical protein HY554_04390 [Elusimicrobia bacterium]|nr:hypothetical protein [Elusimicrobiota bacterium]
MNGWFRRFYFQASMRWHVVALQAPKVAARLARAGYHILIALVVGFFGLGLAERRGLLPVKTGWYDPAPPPPAPAPLKLAAPPDSVANVLPEPLGDTADRNVLVVPEEAPQAPSPAPARLEPAALDPVPEPPRRRLRLVRARPIVEVPSQVPVTHAANLDQRRKGVLRRFDAVERGERAARPPGSQAREPEAPPEPPATAAGPRRVTVESTSPALPVPVAPDPLAEALPVRGAGARERLRDARPALDEGAQARARRAEEEAEAERRRRRDLLKRAKLGLGLSAGLVLLGILLSGIHKGLRRPDLS